VAAESPRSKFIRPKLKVHAMWAYGWTLGIFVLHETGAHDSSCTIDLLAQTLESVLSSKPVTFFSYAFGHPR
jgi:hypothetical protein